MSQSQVVAAAACLLLVASAAAESDSLLFGGRQLQARTKPITFEFTVIDSPVVWLSPTSTTGLVLGFVSLSIFLLFTVVKIIWDEYKRHVKFSLDIVKAKNHLV